MTLIQLSAPGCRDLYEVPRDFNPRAASRVMTLQEAAAGAGGSSTAAVLLAVEEAEDAPDAKRYKLPAGCKISRVLPVTGNGSYYRNR